MDDYQINRDETVALLKNLDRRVIIDFATDQNNKVMYALVLVQKDNLNVQLVAVSVENECDRRINPDNIRGAIEFEGFPGVKLALWNVRHCTSTGDLTIFDQH